MKLIREPYESYMRRVERMVRNGEPFQSYLHDHGQHFYLLSKKRLITAEDRAISKLIKKNQLIRVDQFDGVELRILYERGAY